MPSRPCCSHFGRRRVELRAELRRPVAIERVELHDRRRADVPDRQPNARGLGVTDVRGVACICGLSSSPRRGQPAVAEPAESGGVNDRRPARRRGLGLIADVAEMVERVTGDADASGSSARRKEHDKEKANTSKYRNIN